MLLDGAGGEMDRAPPPPRIGASGAPAGVACQLYSSTALFVLGYVAQVRWPPEGLEDFERRRGARPMRPRQHAGASLAQQARRRRRRTVR